MVPSPELETYEKYLRCFKKNSSFKLHGTLSIIWFLIITYDYSINKINNRKHNINGWVDVVCKYMSNLNSFAPVTRVVFLFLLLGLGGLVWNQLGVWVFGIVWNHKGLTLCEHSRFLLILILSVPLTPHWWLIVFGILKEEEKIVIVIHVIFPMLRYRKKLQKKRFMKKTVVKNSGRNSI